VIDISRIALNRMACPSLPLGEFLQLAAGLSLGGVELRNDLPGPNAGRITDDQTPPETRRLAEKLRLKVLTINALQMFNLRDRLERTRTELEQLLAVCAELDCPAIVMCPNNDPRDPRGPEARRADTVECLKALRPLFERSGRLGYVEPLGFGESSLSSLAVGAAVVREVGGSCYRLVWDTFHHYLGPDSPEVLGNTLHVAQLGLVHVSAVEAEKPAGGYRDEHRLLPSRADRMKSGEQIARLVKLGYRGPISIEPFSPAVLNLGAEPLRAALKQSVEYLKTAG
jgi:2-keto-myo-inositol isomerase